MKFGFHAHLSQLGFDGVYPIYWIKQSIVWYKIYILENMHAQDLKKQINTWFMQQSSANELGKNYWASKMNKSTRAQRFISFKQIKYGKKEWDNTLPKEQGSNK